MLGTAAPLVSSNHVLVAVPFLLIWWGWLSWFKEYLLEVSSLVSE